MKNAIINKRNEFTNKNEDLHIYLRGIDLISVLHNRAIYRLI